MRAACRFDEIVGSLFFARLIDVSLRGIRGPLGSVLRHPILATSGRVSYSAFLLHNFTELLVPPIGIVGALLQTDGQALVLVPLTFALAYLVWLYVEVPIARVRQNLYDLRPARHPVTDALSPAA